MNNKKKDRMSSSKSSGHLLHFLHFMQIFVTTNQGLSPLNFILIMVFTVYARFGIINGQHFFFTTK